jgi:hypothetical protein
MFKGEFEGETKSGMHYNPLKVVSLTTAASIWFSAALVWRLDLIIILL